MIGSLELAISRIGDYYKLSRNAYANSLINISSGIKYHEPKDGVAEYMRIQRLQQDQRGYRVVQRNLSTGLYMMNVAEHIGTQIVEDMKQLKHITLEYWDADPGSMERNYLEIEFNGIVTDIENLQDNAVFQGLDLMQNGTVTSIMLNPNDISQTLDIAYNNNDIVDTTVLAVDAGVDYDATIAIIDTEFNKSMSYLSKTSGYIYSVNSQMAVTDSIIENNSAFESALNDIDDADEIKNLISHEIRQQASLSMMVHANMIRMGVLKLIE